MPSEKTAGVKRATELLVALPVIHILVTSLFLIGYYYSFGNKVYLFSTPSDIFNASVGSVGPNYISSLTIPIVFLFWNRGYFGAWTWHEAAHQKPEGEERERALIKLKSDKKFIDLLVVIFGTSQLIFAIISYIKQGYIPYPLVSFFVMLIFVFFSIWYANRIEIDSISVHVSMMLGIILIGSAFNGMATGQADRRMPYLEAAKSSLVCKYGAALRSIGDHILMVRRDGVHLIVDHDCKPIMMVPRV